MIKNPYLLYGTAAVCSAILGIFVATKNQDNDSDLFGAAAIASISSISAKDLCAWCISDSQYDTTACLAYLAGFRDGGSLQIAADNRSGKAARYICIPPNTPGEEIRGILRKICLDQPNWTPDNLATVAAGAAFRKAYSCH